nr:MAG TPA: baseplate wedge protein [Caudoviricetes sp.]
MYDFMKNQNNVTLALANGLWQPSTAYTVGTVIHSPSLPAGCKATCTTEGTTGSTEPKWTAYGTTVTDGTVKWAVETDVQGTMDGERKKAIDDMHSTITGEVQNAITSAINTLHDTIKTEMQTAMLALFPVGTILETTNDTNPSTYIGGTWEQLDAGLTTITAGTYKETHNGTEDTYVFTAGSSEFTVNGTKAQGEAKHQITEGEMASHGHAIHFYNDDWNSSDGNGGEYNQPGIVHDSIDRSAKNTNRWTDLVESTGGNQPHNNLSPLYGAYKFRRIS